MGRDRKAEIVIALTVGSILSYDWSCKATSNESEKLAA
jgi:hypothetical protein